MTTPPRSVIGDTPGPIGPTWTDANLTAWCAAASDADLPTPTRSRWQQLRAGVVNLWEYDVAEYWFADGRAQLAGGNQSGKSTLMALTTLILLTGDLERRALDTFGKEHKAFRYYLEPSGDDEDRRDTTSNTNRGWAWLEFGRMCATGPEYYTLALYAEAKRGTSHLSRDWVIATGPRVRGGLDLHVGQAVTPAKTLKDMPGVRTWTNGSVYSSKVASELFGFSDTERLDTLTAMLRVLRLPHLGQQLNPDFFTRQMRQALPAVDSVAITTLADGWDQLDRLAEDRDAAEAALKALRTFITSAFNPWADAVLRSRADALSAAVTRFDDVTRKVGEAERARDEHARNSDALTAEIARLEKSRAEADIARDTLLASKAVQDAQGLEAQIAALTAGVARTAADVRGRKLDADRAGDDVNKAEGLLTVAGAELEAATAAQANLLAGLRTAPKPLGLPDDTADWLTQGDLDRVTTAVTERRSVLRTLGDLLGKAAAADRAFAAADAEHTAAARDVDATGAALREQQDTWTKVSQTLADDVERWATEAAGALAEATDPDGVAPAAPAPAARAGWVAQAISAAAAGNRSSTLPALIDREWRDPATLKLTGVTARHNVSAQTADKAAEAAEAEADVIAKQSDDAPPPPVGWTRRARPGAGPDGAPLWRLLDPVIEGEDLDILEAALAASGVLDTWVSVDGRWLAARDGDDAVATLAEPPVSLASTSTLEDVCTVAADAGPVARTVAAIAAQIAVVDPGAQLPIGYPISVSLDGRWANGHAHGRTGRSSDGAALLGAAAREAARARKINELRHQAARHRETAGAARTRAKHADDLAVLVRAQAGARPDESALLAAASDVRAAEREEQRAHRRLGKAQSALTDAETHAANSSHAVVTHANTHRLPTDQPAASALGELLDTFSIAVTPYASAAANASGLRREVGTLTRAHAEALKRLRDAHGRVNAAETADTNAKLALKTATDALNSDVRALLSQVNSAREESESCRHDYEAALKKTGDLASKLAKAQAALDTEAQLRATAEAERARALAAFLVPVRAGLATARGFDELADENLTRGLELARAVRSRLTPRNWPDSADARLIAERKAWTTVTTKVAETRALLETAGGRTLTVVDAAATEETGTDDREPTGDVLPFVTVTVDAAGAALTPWQAAARLGEQVIELSDSHDTKLAEVLTELLSSTFVNHLRSRALSVDGLLSTINTILGVHPTGANATVLRLRHQAPPDGESAYAFIRTLIGGFLDDPGVNATLRDFLHGQVRLAQERGKAANSDWKDELEELLDYRLWFDVVADSKVTGGSWRPLTREKHDVDSGGGKAVTLLQPLLATLVALYNEDPCAPHPVWLDEAFAGVDGTNRAMMLDLFTEFDLDFLMAGPGAIVASASVPAAAIWNVNRAPAPLAGVDLSLTLWTGRDRTTRVIPTDFVRPNRRLQPSVAAAQDTLLPLEAGTDGR